MESDKLFLKTVKSFSILFEECVLKALSIWPLMNNDRNRYTINFISGKGCIHRIRRQGVRLRRSGFWSPSSVFFRWASLQSVSVCLWPCLLPYSLGYHASPWITREYFGLLEAHEPILKWTNTPHKKHIWKKAITYEKQPTLYSLPVRL